MTRTARRLLLLTVLATLALSAVAGADSVVFIRDGNVWLANADGTSPYQVTLDGTAATPYESPSEADNGTILAIRQPPGQRNQLFRMTQSGGLLNAPINTPAPGPAGALDAKISPDGTLVAYWFVTTVNDPFCAFCGSVASQTLLSHADRFTNYDEVGTPHTGIQPSWVNNTTVLMSNSNGEQWTYTLGQPVSVLWFTNSDIGFTTDFATLSDSEVAPSGDRMVVLKDQPPRLLVLPMAGLPPTKPTASLCGYMTSSDTFASPTWSGDGTRVYWQGADGIWMASVPNTSTCDSPSLILAGAGQPDGSPAANAPGARPGCANPGNPVACVVPPPTPIPPPCTTCAPIHPVNVTKALSSELKTVLTSAGSALAKLKIAGLRKKHKLSFSFKAPVAGVVKAQYTVPGPKKHTTTTLATASHTFKAAGKATVSLALTSKGTKALKHAHTLKGTLTLAFTPKGAKKATSAHRTLTLH